MTDIIGARHAQLSREEHKLAFYHRETYFRDGLADIDRAVAHRRLDATGFHRSTALMMLKPDGLRHGIAGTVLDVLTDWGFEVAWADTVVLARHVWRELWRYQLNVATRRRLDYNEYLFDEPGVLLMLRRPEDRDLPAAVELASRKGSATMERQGPDCLRAQLGQPHRVLSLIHVADEPADVVRELGLLLDRPRRRAAIDAVLDGTVAPTETIADRAREHAGDQAPGLPTPPEAEARLRAALAAASDPAASELLTLVDTAPAAGGLDWALAAPLVGRTAAAVDRWDLLAASASWLRPDDPRYVKTVDGMDPDAWLRPAPEPIEAV